MIVGIGIDIIEIERFADWKFKSHKQLRRIFNQEEIEYALSVPEKTAERFAARFAAREALYKATVGLIEPMPFLSLCAQTSLLGTPIKLYFDPLRKYNAHVSWSHSRTHATALVIIEKPRC